MTVKKEGIKKENLRQFFIHNFIGGIATGLGLTVGIALVSYLLSILVSHLDSLPFIGDLLTNIVNATLESLNKK